jgi:hypothetical protein
MSHGSLEKTVVQMKRKAPPDPEAASAKQSKDDARDLRLYNCAQCQCTCWGLQQLANHVLRAHGPTSLLGGQFPGAEGKVPLPIPTQMSQPGKYATCVSQSRYGRYRFRICHPSVQLATPSSSRSPLYLFLRGFWIRTHRACIASWGASVLTKQVISLPVLRIRIRDPVLFDPGFQGGKKSGSGMNIPNHFSDSLETVYRV